MNKYVRIIVLLACLIVPQIAQAQTTLSQSFITGWNLTGNNSPATLDPIAVFGNATVPVSGISNQIITVWKWDAANTRWMFFAPSYDPAGLATYATAKGYGVMSAILPGDGYWVNAAAAISFALPPALTGVAASGGPIANGAVAITCGDGSVKAATTDANGAYAVPLGTCGAPYVVSVTGMIGDAEETLVSLHPTALASTDSSLTVNITPLTHALAATIASSGDPLDLVSNFSAEKANITATAVNQRKTALAASLADTLTTAGIDPTKFDLINGRFSADRTGLDKVLDNVKVQVLPTGVSMTNVAGVKVDDMGDAPPSVPSDLSAGTVSFTKATDFTVPLPKVKPDLDDHSVGDTIRDALNACFAQPAATRGTFGSNNLSAVCAALPIASDYLHDGRDRSHEFDGFLSNVANDNATFGKPEIVRFFSNDQATPDVRALIKFVLTRADGIVQSFMTVGEKSAATSGAKMLRGNRRPFRMFVNGAVNKRVQIATRNAITNPASTFYFTSINLYFGMQEGGASPNGGGTATTNTTGRKVDYVKVTGPGLPSLGIILRATIPGCDQNYAIVSNSGVATATGSACTSLFRLASRPATATDTDIAVSANFGAQPYARATAATDAEILAFQPFSAYKFEVWKTGNATATPDHVFYERLRSRPVTMGTVTSPGEVDKMRWDTLAQSTINSILPTSSTPFTGGSSFTVAWLNQPNTRPIAHVQVQLKPAGLLYQDSSDVGFKQSSRSLTNGGVAWPDASATAGSGNFNLVQLMSRNRFDTQQFHDWQY